MSGRFALVIGNSKYLDANLSRLKTPEADARALAAALRNPAIGDFNHVQEVINQDESSVRRAISAFFTDKKPDDLLLLYFSGHGVLDPQGRLFLAVQDTQRELLKATAIPASFVSENMDDCRSKRQVLILDCCHSGAFARGTKGDAPAVTQSTFAGSGYGRVVLTASDATQYALEGDQVVEQASLSLFTQYLLNGLTTGEADSEQDGWISLDEWYDYAYDRVRSETPRQTPRKWVYNQQGELIIARNPRFSEATSSLLPAKLRARLKSTYTPDRLEAIQELEVLLKGDYPALALTAQATLEHLASEDDSLTVRSKASGVLKIPLVSSKQDLKEKTEHERLAREQAEAERLERERVEAERLARERAEAERLAREKSEQERLERERVEAERLARKRAEAERLAREKSEQERLERERFGAVPSRGEKAKQDRVAEEKTRKDRAAFVPDVLQESIHIETLGGVSTPLIEKGAKLPVETSQVFSTAADNQSQVEMHLVMGERPMAADNRSLGKFILDGIPPAPKGVPQLEVKIAVGKDHVLRVTAIDKATLRSQSLGNVDLKTYEGGFSWENWIADATKSSGGGTLSVSQDNSEANFSDIFEKFFGVDSKRGSQGSADLHYTLTLPFEEAVRGVEKIIEFTRAEPCQACNGSGAQPGTRVDKCDACGGSGEVREKRQTLLGEMVHVQTCKTCNGSGKIIQSPCKHCEGKGVISRKVRLAVSIPAGINTGMSIRLAGEGQPGRAGAPNGNLYLKITVSAHPLFSRQGDDLHLEYLLTREQITKGGTFKIPTLLKGKPVQLKIPPGSAENSTFTIKGQGVPRMKGEGKGNLVVVLRVYDPRASSKEREQKLALIREYAGK